MSDAVKLYFFGVFLMGLGMAFSEGLADGVFIFGIFTMLAGVVWCIYAAIVRGIEADKRRCEEIERRNDIEVARMRDFRKN